MYERIHMVPDKLRWLCIGTLVLLATLMIFSLVLPAPDTSASSEVQSTPTPVAAADPDAALMSYDGPNAVTNAMLAAANAASASLDSTARATQKTGLFLRRSSLSVASAGYHSGRFMAHGLQTGATMLGRGVVTGATTVGRGARTGVVASASFVGHTIYYGVAAAVYVPRVTVSYAANTALVSSVIQPAEKMPVQTISTLSPVALTTPAAASPAAETSAAAPIPAPAVVAWPIHGEITTLFGVPEWPYQPIHTGLDISDGNRSGTTPIHPYRAGKVTEVVRSYLGLGNHVVVDHGDGLTSVYGHMYSTNVQVGQAVDTNSVLGMEGSTGASTGAHVHFEIKLNGQYQDPLKFIPGRP
jgi:murein DD-endopeptidase MepM/ murein hydrolase activator NlpD